MNDNLKGDPWEVFEAQLRAESREQDRKQLKIAAIGFGLIVLSAVLLMALALSPWGQQAMAWIDGVAK